MEKHGKVWEFYWNTKTAGYRNCLLMYMLSLHYYMSMYRFLKSPVSILWTKISFSVALLFTTENALEVTAALNQCEVLEWNSIRMYATVRICMSGYLGTLGSCHVLTPVWVCRKYTWPCCVVRCSVVQSGNKDAGLVVGDYLWAWMRLEEKKKKKVYAC